MSYNVSECFCAFVWWRQTSWFSSLVRFIDFTQKDSHFNITWLMSLTPLQTELPYALEVLPLAHSWYLTCWTLSSLWYRKGKWGKRKRKIAIRPQAIAPHVMVYLLEADITITSSKLTCDKPKHFSTHCG